MKDVLPYGWTATTLGEIGCYRNGRAFKSEEWSTRGRMIIRIQDLTGSGDSPNFYEGTIEQRYEVHPGDLLISWAATLGAYIWRGPEAVLNQHIFKVESYIDPTFHFYLVTAILDDLRRQAHGSGMVHITKSKFDSTPVLLPPLAEQRRIVAALEEHLSDLDAAVAMLGRTHQRLSVLVASVLQAAANDTLINGHSVAPSATQIEWRPLREVIESIDQGWSPKCLSDPPMEENHWGVIKTTAIQPTRFNCQESKALPQMLQPRPHLEIQVGDLLVTRKGPRNRAGVAAAVRKTRRKLMICDTVYRIRLKEHIARPHFIAIAMSAPQVAMMIDAAKAGISESGVSLTHDRLGAINVPLPTLQNQQRLEDEVDRRLAAAEWLVADIDIQLARAVRLRQSILKRAFEGKLVPQDPNDEPTSVLLTQIGIGHRGSPAHTARSKRSRVTTY